MFTGLICCYGFSLLYIVVLTTSQNRKNNTKLYLQRICHAKKLHQMFASGLHVSHLAVFERRHNGGHGRSANQRVAVL